MPLPDPHQVSAVAVVGAGTIGASWAAWFLARGCTVALSDPDPNRAPFARDYVEAAWPALERIGAVRATGAAWPDRLNFHLEMEQALSGAEFVQENVFERLDLKRDVLARIDAALPPDRVIASSTSGFEASVLQRGLRHPGRLVIGHPFNPPHLIPLVEVVGGAATAPETADWALAFYRAMGKRPIRIRKEVPGHLANRLQAALWREAVHLVVEGVASVEDVDAAVAYGPGLRWALMGPHLTFHLGGGEGGMQHFVDHIGPPMESWWASLGHPTLTPEVKQALVSGVEDATGGRRIPALAAERDRRLLDLLDALRLTGPARRA